MKKKTVFDMTARQLRSVELARWDEVIVCNSLVVLPTKLLHDSGYRVIEFVAVDENLMPIKRIAGGIDVVCFDGIGGYGWNWHKKNEGVPTKKDVTAWRFDCLPKSGLLRLFIRGKEKIRTGSALSTFEIWSVE
jgi:hypothetical protein